MPTPSWRDLLKEVISDPAEHTCLAQAIGVNPVTLKRWVQSTSKNPHMHKLHQLVEAFPDNRRALLVELLQQEYGPFPQFDDLHDEPDRIDYAFIRQVWDMWSRTPAHLLFYTMSGKIIENAMRQLDAQSLGMSITCAQLMPLSAQGRTRSLREVVGRGSPPWSPDIEHHTLFLGSDSLAGYAVTNMRPAFIDDLKESRLLPVYRTQHEVSAAACPICYANKVAGCLIFSSTQRGFFSSEPRQALVKDYAYLLAPAFQPDQFFEPEQVELQVMPEPEIQYQKFTTFRPRVNALMRSAFFEQPYLTGPQVEQQVWQQIEQELLNYFKLG